ncbi:CIC11C00000003825 [Sungouiella intermedia]|uniref:CIC11C00000002245 n=1 Tax=Sungouiella intermedia TaxID=45354 RepID=A0A1L0C0L6_9ASCO|nr:CIC11C00000002245 [[Candida] intermedia]SGZ57258.1 CIC11C00000003825 [[Candida] intermedia]
MADSFNDPYNFDGYPAVKGLLRLTQTINNGAADGTGIRNLVDICHNLMGPVIPQIITDYSVSMQNNLFGGYPTSSDIAPSIVFACIFGILGLFHIVIFSINTWRGHHFWISFAWFLNCMITMLGFVFRVEWARDISWVNVGLVSEIFLILTSVIFASFDLILAQRLFTWRHPVGGSRKLFWGFMWGTYIGVILILIVTILAAFVPYINFLSHRAYENWKIVVMVTSICVILYSLTSMSLIGLSYLFPPTKKDENLYTYQPWWIESFKPFYFVKRNAARDAAETFMKRNHNHRHAIRVIAATHHHYNMVEGLTNQRGTLDHNVSMLLIVVTTILIFIGAVLRSITLFQNRINRHLSNLCQPFIMYICWGGFESLINVLYIVGRVDLRFYRPDRLPKQVRNIVTAEQSYYPSENEEEDSYTQGTGLYSTVNDKSFDFAQQEPSPGAQSPPYPKDDYFYEKNRHNADDDNISDFHF